MLFPARLLKQEHRGGAQVEQRTCSKCFVMILFQTLLFAGSMYSGCNGISSVIVRMNLPGDPTAHVQRLKCRWGFRHGVSQDDAAWCAQQRMRSVVRRDRTALLTCSGALARRGSGLSCGAPLAPTAGPAFHSTGFRVAPLWRPISLPPQSCNLYTAISAFGRKRGAGTCSVLSSLSSGVAWTLDFAIDPSTASSIFCLKAATYLSSPSATSATSVVGSRCNDSSPPATAAWSSSLGIAVHGGSLPTCQTRQTQHALQCSLAKRGGQLPCEDTAQVTRISRDHCQLLHSPAATPERRALLGTLPAQNQTDFTWSEPNRGCVCPQLQEGF